MNFTIIQSWHAVLPLLGDWSGLIGMSWMEVFDLLASIAQRFAALTLVCDEEGINHGFDGSCGLTRQLGSRLSVWHSGQIQNYLRAISLGVLALIIVYLWLL